MKKKTPLPAKITIGIATIGIISIVFGMIKENGAISIAGLTLTLVGFFASFVVSMIMDIKKTYPSRSDSFQRKMRILSYIRLVAGCTSFLSVGLMMYGLYTADRMTALLYFALSLIAGGIVAVIAVSVVMAVVSKVSTPRADSGIVAPPSDIAVAKIPLCSDPVISRILANPYVLLDERIRQIHEVQNLLQYPEIQQIFFEPTKLYELFTNERVGELLNIVRERLKQSDAGEIFAAVEQRRRSANSPTAFSTQPKKAAKKTNSEIAIIVNLIPAAIVIIIFAAFFITVAFF